MVQVKLGAHFEGYLGAAAAVEFEAAETAPEKQVLELT